MKSAKAAAGFTVIETMIVLAVTGMLFVLIAATLTGRQRQNEFTQSVNDARAQIQQIISEVQTGFYPNLGNFRCIASGSGVTLSAGSEEQGTNGGCVYLGNVIQFGVHDTDPEEYLVFPVAARRTATLISDADPTAIATNGSYDNTTTYKLKYGLKVVKMTSQGVGSIGAVSILSSMGEIGSTATGAPQTDIYALGGTSLDRAKPFDITRVNQALPDNMVKNPTGGVKICFESGGTANYGLVTIGQNNRQLDVGLRIMNKNSSNQDCGI